MNSPWMSSLPNRPDTACRTGRDAEISPASRSRALTRTQGGRRRSPEDAANAIGIFRRSRPREQQLPETAPRRGSSPRFPDRVNLAAIQPPDQNWRPRRRLIECQRTVARPFQSGDQRAGNGRPAAQRPPRILSANGRQESRQRTAVRQLAEQPVQARKRVGDPPERGRPGQ